MPFEFNNKIVVTKDELVPDFFKSENTLKSQIQRHKDKPYGIKRIMIGGNGRQLLINFDSLPNEIKEGLGDPRKCDHILERFYSVDPDAVRFFNMFKFPDGTYLKEEHKEKYIINASMLRSLLKLRDARRAERKSKGGKLTGIEQTLLSDSISFNQTLLVKHKVEHTLPESLPHFKAALKKFENGVNGYDYESVISGKHKNTNSRKVDDATLKLLNDMFADKHEKPTATEVHRRYESFLDGYIEVINNKTGEIYDPSGFKRLSTATVTNYIAEWRSAIGTHSKRSSNRQILMSKFSPYHSLEAPKYAGAMISIDDRQPPFKTLDGRRVWFYNGIDLASSAFTCWVYGESKEGIILEFYRQMVRNYAMWGFSLPYELEAELSLNSSFKDTFLRDGAMFQKVRIEANKARAKRIERHFGTLRYQYEKKREGWLARPHALSESNQPGIEIEKVKKLPYEDIIQGCLEDIEKWNNDPHPDRPEMSRWEYFENMQHPDLKPTNYQAILPHIGIRTSTSVNVGIIRFRGTEFLLGIDGKVAAGETLIGFMSRLEGEKIDIYWLDDNEGNVLKALIYHDGQYICEAIEKPRYSRATIERTEQDDINRAIMSAYTATIDAFARRQKASLDGVTIIDNRPAPKKAFVMPGLKRRQPIEEERETEMLPSIEFDDINYYSPNSKSLKDRF